MSIIINRSESNEPWSLDYALLDSSLIVTTNIQEYNIKIINCGDYIQVYNMGNSEKVNKDLELNNSKSKIIIENIGTDNLIIENDKEKVIEEKNITRSKLQCQRLAKTNYKEWKTFVTLTFEDNITDIKFANKKFRYFIDKIQRIFNNFKYIAIPEFQKRGSVHYHLLTNIDINNTLLIYRQRDREKYLHVKYWNEGFTKVDTLENDIKKIIGYISKYMTKDIDNRLYNCHRYFNSRNLKNPNISYLDLSNKKHLDYYNKILSNKTIIYENEYLSTYTNNKIQFKEYL